MQLSICITKVPAKLALALGSLQMAGDELVPGLPEDQGSPRKGGRGCAAESRLRDGASTQSLLCLPLLL